MICSTCTSAIREALPHTETQNLPKSCYQQRTYEDLRQGADSGCKICRELNEQINRFDISIEEAGAIPCTNWHIDSSAFLQITFDPSWLESFVQQQVKAESDVNMLQLPGLNYWIIPLKEDYITNRTSSQDGDAMPVPPPEGCQESPGTRTDSQRSLGLIQHWLSDCTDSHDACEVTAESWYPTRLLDVGLKDSRRLKLHITASKNAETASNYKYITLSHCWGQNFNKQLKLTRHNITRLCDMFQMDELPQTFQDGVDVARRLQIRYLWIDSLCIIQGDEEDWTREANEMHKVYMYGLFNVCATAALDSSQGCYRERDPAEVQPNIVRSEQRKAFAVLPQETWRGGVESMPLNSRGWVLQERILSRRNVHFGAEQVFWECRQSCASESSLGSLPRSVCSATGLARGVMLKDFISGKPLDSYDLDHELTHRNKMEAIWGAIVENFSSCKLTFNSDKLIALAGIAQQFKITTGHAYVAGLWREDLPLGLLWKTKKSQSSRSKAYVAPSWSWASVVGPIEMSPFSMGDRSSVVDDLEILDIQIFLKNSEHPFGQIENGFLRIRGRLGIVFATSSGQHDDSSLSYYITNQHEGLGESSLAEEKKDLLVLVPASATQWQPTWGPSEIAFDEDFSPSIPTNVLLIAIDRGNRRLFGLLLTLLPSGEYARAGYLATDGFLEADDRFTDMLKCLPEHELTIV